MRIRGREKQGDSQKATKAIAAGDTHIHRQAGKTDEQPASGSAAEDEFKSLKTRPGEDEVTPVAVPS